MADNEANGATNGEKKSYKVPFQLKNPELLQDQSLVHGNWVPAKSGHRFEVVDPGNGEAWISCPDNNADDVDAAVESSHKAFLEYRKSNPRQRAKWLLDWYSLIVANTEDIATILTYETGKPLAESHQEIAYASGMTWWFSGEAERTRGTTFIPSAPNRRVFTIQQPIGVAAALVPWNFPIAMILRKAGAALAAGCTMVCKPSPETPLTCLTMAHLALQAGFPPGVLNVLTTSLSNTPSLSESLCKHPLVKKVTFTGSTRVGQIIASHCAPGLKKLTMELGGNCPYIIFDDANLDQALDQLMFLKWRHAGQACISANRIYVQSGVYDQFAEMLRAKTAQLVVGHGANKKTTMGPVTTPRGIEKAQNQITDAVQHGATILLGSQHLQDPTSKTSSSSSSGYFIPPTILTHMTNSMLLTHEETFAPIAALYPFSTESEVIESANNTSMGLASYVFTKNIDRVWRMFENLEAGMVGLNVGNASAAESPFGGIKSSGYGKESGKDVAIGEYLITKTGTMGVEGQW